MKVSRTQLVELLQKHEIATSKKNKPFSNEVLLDLVKEHIDDMTSDEDNTDPLAATLAAALEEETTIKVTGDDPTVPRKVSKEKEAADKEKASSKKSKKPAKEEDDEEEEAPKKKKGKGEKPKAKAEKKEASERDKWGSNPSSSAGQINAVFFGNKKPLTMDQIVEALDSEEISRSRIRDHLRRLVNDGILTKDDKDRFVVPRKAKEE